MREAFEGSITLNDTTFIPPHPLKTAVLFLVFNRPDTTKQVFDAIRKAKPPRLYVAADGPRLDREGEKEKVQAVRDHVMENIDWECEVITLFRDENLGCKYAVSGAITWFFEHEEMGIILEDDCLPSQSFFWFCEELLERYKDDERIWQIGGYNPLPLQNNESDYYFSRLPIIWGWCTWRNRWKHYTVRSSIDDNTKYILKDYFYSNINFVEKWLKSYEKVLKNEISTWDYDWLITVALNNGLSIKPNLNFVENIGFGQDATHTKVKVDINKSKKPRYTNIKKQEIKMNKKTNLKAPPYKYASVESDANYMRLKSKTFLARIVNKVTKPI